MGGVFLFGGLLSVVSLLIPIALILALLVILALRHDDDADALRAPAIYASIVAFVALLTLLLAVTGAVGGLVDLSRGDEFDGRDGDVTTIVTFLIVGAVAGGLLYVHRDLFALVSTAGGAARRVRRAFLLVMCLVTAVLAMGAVGVVLFQVYALLFPDTAGAKRGDAASALVTAAALLAGAVALWRLHWQELDLRLPGAPDHDDTAFRPTGAP